MVKSQTHARFAKPDRAGQCAVIGGPLGNLWWIMTHLEDVSPEEIEKRYGQKDYIDAMQYVEGAEFLPFDPAKGKL